MDTIINKDNTQFCGSLYGKIGNHKTKAIHCCPNGDAKFVKFINKLGKDSSFSNKIKISYSNEGLKKILIETEEIPKINIFEKVFFNTDKAQGKALKLRRKGVISSFIYQLNELEFKHLKDDYLFISQKQLNKFSELIKNNSPKSLQNFLKEFFG